MVAKKEIKDINEKVLAIVLVIAISFFAGFMIGWGLHQPENITTQNTSNEYNLGISVGSYCTLDYIQNKVNGKPDDYLSNRVVWCIENMANFTGWVE